jgi:hypothetical protein
VDETFIQRAKSLRVTIKAAHAMGATIETLASLTDYAGLLTTHGYKGEAAQLLAVIMNHPEVPFDTYDRADDLFIQLESELCPRVIDDARRDASFLTLRGAIDAAFGMLRLPPGEDLPAE